MGSKLLTINEACQDLSLGRSMVYQLVMSGELQSIKIGKARRIPSEAITEFIQSRLEVDDVVTP